MTMTDASTAPLPPPPSLALRSPRPPGELPLRNTGVHHQRTDAHREEYGHQSRVDRLHVAPLLLNRSVT
jgi:hypothetical protein